MAMRVYELAKKLGMENRVLIPELKKLGVSVSSHSSTLDDEIVQKVTQKLAAKSKGHGAGIEGELGPQAVEPTSHGKAMASKSHVVEDPPKPDKRRILIKRKKEDEPVEVMTSVPTVESERSAQLASITELPPPASELPVTGGLVDRSVPAQDSPSETTPPAPAPLDAKQEETPAKPTVAPTTIGAPTPEAVTAKKKSMAFEAIEAEALKEKLKKARKAGRPKDDQQDVKFREDAAR